MKKYNQWLTETVFNVPSIKFSGITLTPSSMKFRVHGGNYSVDGLIMYDNDHFMIMCPKMGITSWEDLEQLPDNANAIRDIIIKGVEEKWNGRRFVPNYVRI